MKHESKERQKNKRNQLISQDESPGLNRKREEEEEGQEGGSIAV